MAPLFQIFLLCCITINLLTAQLQISCGEEDSSVFIEGVVFPSCYCYGTEDDVAIFDWTFVHETGRLEHLATCHGQGNCTTFATFDLKANMFSRSSSLDFHNLTFGLTGTLVCSETTSTFHGSTNFTMKVTRASIVSAPDSKVIPLLEGSNSESLNCEHSPYTPNTVTWIIITQSGQPVQAGSCSSPDNYNCSSLLSSTITLEGSSTSSSIFFNNGSIHRNMSAVVCTVSFPDSVDSDKCTLDIYSQAIVENCSIEVCQQNWSFIFSCDISNDFSSEGQYGFKVYETFYLLLRGQLRQVDSIDFDDYYSYRQYLTPYINSTNKELYYRGRLVYSWPVPPYPGTYRSFQVETFHQATAQLTLEKGLNVSYPARPTHNCSDVMSPCSCSTESLGSPAGRLLWLIGNTAVAIGDYDVRQLLMSLDNLPSRQNMTVATCQLDWIQILVAEAPAILRREQEHTGNESEENTGKNTGNDTVEDTGKDTRGDTENDTGEDKFKILTIAGWSLLIVVVVVIVTVVVILMRLGHLVRRPCKNSTEGEEADEVHSQNYVRLQTSRVVGGGSKEDEVGVAVITTPITST